MVKKRLQYNDPWAANEIVEESDTASIQEVWCMEVSDSKEVSMGTVKVSYREHRMKWLLDTGADVHVMPEDFGNR